MMQVSDDDIQEITSEQFDDWKSARKARQEAATGKDDVPSSEEDNVIIEDMPIEDVNAWRTLALTMTPAERIADFRKFGMEVFSKIPKDIKEAALNRFLVEKANVAINLVPAATLHTDVQATDEIVKDDDDDQVDIDEDLSKEDQVGEDLTKEDVSLDAAAAAPGDPALDGVATTPGDPALDAALMDTLLGQQ